MPEKKICKGCGSHWVVNMKYSLCDSCNYLRLHGMSKEDDLRRKEQAKVITYKPKPKKASQKAQNLLRKEKYAELKRLDFETYKKVFEERPNKCEECDAELNDVFEMDGEILGVWQYSHILSKAAYPEFRHDKRNFNRLCFHDHQRWETGDRQNMNIYPKNLITIKELINDRLHISGNE